MPQLPDIHIPTPLPAELVAQALKEAAAAKAARDTAAISIKAANEALRLGDNREVYRYKTLGDEDLTYAGRRLLDPTIPVAAGLTAIGREVTIGYEGTYGLLQLFPMIRRPQGGFASNRVRLGIVLPSTALEDGSLEPIPRSVANRLLDHPDVIFDPRNYIPK